MSDDPGKCAHKHRGLASQCAYHTAGYGTLGEHIYWRCSEACKAEQRRLEGMRNRKPAHVLLIEARAADADPETIAELEREVGRECDAIRARGMIDGGD